MAGEQSANGTTQSSIGTTSAAPAAGEGAVATPAETVADQTQQNTTQSNNELVSRETSAEEKPAEVPEAQPDGAYSSKFAKLAKKDREIRAREASLKELEKTLGPLHTAIQSKDAKAILEAVRSSGLTFQQLAEAAIDDGQPPTAEKLAEGLEKKLEEMKAELAADKANQKQRYVKEQYDLAQKQIGEFLDSAPDDYELILTHFTPEEARAEVFEVIKLQHKESGQLLSYKEAADMLERHFEAEAKKYLTAKKFAPKVTPSEVPTDKGDGQPISQQTLTSSLVNSAGMKSNEERFLSDEESKERLARRLSEAAQQ